MIDALGVTDVTDSCDFRLPCAVSILRVARLATHCVIYRYHSAGRLYYIDRSYVLPSNSLRAEIFRRYLTIFLVIDLGVDWKCINDCWNFFRDTLSFVKLLFLRIVSCILLPLNHYTYIGCQGNYFDYRELSRLLYIHCNESVSYLLYPLVSVSIEISGCIW